MKSVMVPYRQEDHGDFDAEWPVQRGVTGSDLRDWRHGPLSKVQW
ncbi:MAG: hypothetical protein ABSG63_10620 [Spirochaetia bacterium]